MVVPVFHPHILQGVCADATLFERRNHSGTAFPAFCSNSSSQGCPDFQCFHSPTRCHPSTNHENPLLFKICIPCWARLTGPASTSWGNQRMEHLYLTGKDRKSGEWSSVSSHFKSILCLNLFFWNALSSTGLGLARYEWLYLALIHSQRKIKCSSNTNHCDWVGVQFGNHVSVKQMQNRRPDSLLSTGSSCVCEHTLTLNGPCTIDSNNHFAA